MIYTVKKGDTVYDIAKRYQVLPDDLIEINGLSDPDSLSVGQALIVAKPSLVHKVLEGETIYSIARQYDVSLSSLYRKNPRLKGSPNVNAGERLVIRWDSDGSLPLSVNGFSYPCIKESVLTATLPYLSSLAPFSYGFTAEGDLSLPMYDTTVERAKTSGVDPVMLLTTLNSDGKFDNSLSHRLLEDGGLEDALIDSIINAMRLVGYRVLMIDFEFLFQEDKAGYVEFLKKIRKHFEPYRYQLWVALPPKTSKGQSGALFDGIDYRAIGEIADAVQLMTYEWGYQYHNKNAVLPFSELQKAVSYALSEIPPEKILIGVPNYGYDIVLSAKTSDEQTHILSNVDAISLANEKHAEILYDIDERSPYFRYYENACEHLVVFGDARSMEAVLGLVNKNALRGISIYTVMQYFPQGYFLLSPYRI